MNEKFGFLSNFGGIKVKSVKKKSPVYVTPKRGELTDDPPANNPLLTDDESGEEEVPETIHQQRVINRILESSSSSSIFAKRDDIDPDLTYCSVLEPSGGDVIEAKSPNVCNSRSEPILNSQHSSSIANTVEGGFSDDELCSKMSEVYVRQKKTPSSRSSAKDNGPFSDNEQKAELKKIADTVIYSSDDDDFEEPILPLPRSMPKKKTMAKASLPDTIVGFSESMSELSIRQEAVPVAQAELEETDSECEVIEVLDSEEEEVDGVSPMNDFDQPPIIPTDDSFQNCSSVVSSRQKASADSDTTVNRFFNNPPSVSPDRVVSHSIIQRHREQRVISVPSPVKEIPSNVSADRFKVVTEEDIVNESLNEDVELVQTDTSNEDPEVEVPESHQPPESEVVESEVVESQEIVPSQRTRQPSSSSSSSSDNQTIYENISISAKININLKLKLTMKESRSSSSSDESSSSSSDSNPPSPKQTPRKAAARESFRNVTSDRKGNSSRKEKQMAKPGSTTKTTPKVINEFPNDDFRTPTKAPPVEELIDEDLQKILDSLYGESWKTPQLLRSCKSKTIRQDLRKSIHANNFENFVKNLPRDLESTRITASSSDESVKNQKIESADKRKKNDFVTPKNPEKSQSSTKKKPSSIKKTPSSSNKIIPAKTTSRYLEVCDSDTMSESSSDEENFKPDETWNASSDDEYKDEAERIKKRSIARKSQKDEEIIFVPDDSAEEKQKKLDDLLDRYEYKKPTSMQGTDTPTKKPSKRKLFTHSHYDEDLNLDSTPDDDDERKKNGKENDENIVNLPMVFFPRPLPVLMKEPAKKLEMPPLPIVVKRTPKSKTQTPRSTSKPLENKFAAYSFLKSLDVEVNPTLCNADALYYRSNYKSKRIELTEKLFKLYDEKVFDGQLSEVPVKWNKKLLNTAGRCNNSRRGGVRQSQLELSEKVLTSADRLRCTLIHEMCHAATWIIQAENGHGATWKRWAAKANSTFPELPKINVCHDYVIEYRFTYQCSNCKAKYQAHSKSKKVENIRCSICRGSIELFLNKKNKDGEVVMTPVSKDVKGFPKFVKINYKDVKKPNMTHKEVMQLLSQQFGCLSVEEKQNL